MARSASFMLALAAAAVLLIAGVTAQVRLALAAPRLCAHLKSYTCQTQRVLQAFRRTSVQPHSGDVVIIHSPQ
jgi:hypothetical protein